jgi:plastocyanin
MRHSTLSIMCPVALLFLGLIAPLALASDTPPANATISFGQWQTDPPFDRAVLTPLPPSTSTQGPNDRTRNEHQLIPSEVTIQAGGAVNFIISGFHQILVYKDTAPDDFNAGTTPTVPPKTQPMPPLIDEPTNRVYRGLDPSLPPFYRSPETTFIQDRIEAVHFPNAGTYLVICGVHPHFFNDGMFGFVRVVPGE